jgi:hypothetical protein
MLIYELAGLPRRREHLQHRRLPGNQPEVQRARCQRMSEKILGGLLGNGWAPPEYDENLEELHFELENARIDYRELVERGRPGGLFGLGAAYLIQQRERTLLKYARENHISLRQDNWRQQALERIAWNWIDAQSRQRKRGRPKKRSLGLLAPDASEDASVLDTLDLIRSWARRDNYGYWSDAKCIEFLVVATEFGGKEPSSEQKKLVLAAHCRTMRNKVSRLRTKLKRKPGFPKTN